TELSRREMRIIGNFALGPDFSSDGTVITSDRTFLKFFAPHQLAAGELADVEFGVIKVRPGYSVELVQHTLKQALPASIAVRTTAEWLAPETPFLNSGSPPGPIFLVRTATRFFLGKMNSYQNFFTSSSQPMSPYS